MLMISIVIYIFAVTREILEIIEHSIKILSGIVLAVCYLLLLRVTIFSRRWRTYNQLLNFYLGLHLPRYGSLRVWKRVLNVLQRGSSPVSL